MKRIIFSLCLLALFISCQNSEESPAVEPDTIEDSGFYALRVGNTWTYKNYKYNSISEIYEDTGVIDVVKIVGTEEINAITYYKFRTVTTGNEEGITFCNPNGESFKFLRELEGDLMNENGEIKFTNNNFLERLLWEESWGTVNEKLVEGSTEIEVEAGLFTCVNSERYAKLTSNGEQAPALDRFYYSNGIGLISDTSSYISNPIHIIERRLDFYSVQ